MGPGLREYTRAELLSLRAVPGAGGGGGRRSAGHRLGAVRRLFAAGDGAHVLVGDGGGGVHLAAGGLAAHAQAILPVLRYGRGVASLNLYPTSAACVAGNEALWRAARAGEHAARGDAAFGANVLALAMREELFALLRRVTLRGLRRRVLRFLELLARDETPAGLALMRGELEPGVWQALARLRAAGARADRRTLADVELLRRLCCLSPWRVDVYAAYVTPADMRAAIAAQCAGGGGAAAEGAPAPPPPPAEAPLAPQGLPARVRARAPSRNVVYWKLFRDWLTYRRIWVERLGVHPADAAQAMCAAVADGRHNAAWARAEAVLMCAARDGNLFSRLPKDVVCNVLAPHVLLAGCADRRELRERSGGEGRSRRP